MSKKQVKIYSIDSFKTWRSNRQLRLIQLIAGGIKKLNLPVLLKLIGWMLNGRLF